MLLRPVPADRSPAISRLAQVATTEVANGVSRLFGEAYEIGVKMPGPIEDITHLADATILGTRALLEQVGALPGMGIQWIRDVTKRMFAAVLTIGRKNIKDDHHPIRQYTEIVGAVGQAMEKAWQKRNEAFETGGPKRTGARASGLSAAAAGILAFIGCSVAAVTGKLRQWDMDPQANVQPANIGLDPLRQARIDVARMRAVSPLIETTLLTPSEVTTIEEPQVTVEIPETEKFANAKDGPIEGKPYRYFCSKEKKHHESVLFREKNEWKILIDNRYEFTSSDKLRDEHGWLARLGVPNDPHMLIKGVSKKGDDIVLHTTWGKFHCDCVFPADKTIMDLAQHCRGDKTPCIILTDVEFTTQGLPFQLKGVRAVWFTIKDLWAIPAPVVPPSFSGGTNQPFFSPLRRE